MVRKPTELNSHDAASVERERISQRYTLGRTFCRMLAIVGVAYFAKEMIVSLAGQSTFVALKMAFLADFKVALSFAMAGVATFWARDMATPPKGRVFAREDQEAGTRYRPEPDDIWFDAYRENAS